MNGIFFPYPNFTQSSNKNASLVLDVPELVQWGQRVANAGMSVNHALDDIAKELADIKEFITFATTQDPDILQKFHDFKAIKEKVDQHV